MFASDLCARLPTAMQPSPTSESVLGTVTRLTDEPKTAPRGGYLFRGLELRSEPESDRVFILCPELAGDHLYEFPLLCWEGAHVGAFRVELNNRLDDGTRIYHVSPRSDLILEPCRPVTVTEAVEATRCVRSVDVGLRVSPAEPFWMAKGKLIHSLFDRLIQASTDSDDATFDEAFRSGLPRFREILAGSGVSITAEDLKREARTHFSNLAGWLRSTEPLFDWAEVEADRISTRWGLRGRADAILHVEPQAKVVEIKSGRTVAEEHLMQLFAYCLLVSEEDDRFPEGCVIYSSTGRMENLTGFGEETRQAIIAARNRVVALKHMHTAADRGLALVWDGEFNCRGQQCFARRHCHRLFGSDSGKPPTLLGKERDYYQRWFRVLSQELWAVEGELARRLDGATLAGRVSEGITIRGSAVTLESFHEHASGSEGKSGQPLHGQRGLRRESWRPERRALVCVELPADGHPVDFSAGEEVFLHRGDPCAPGSFRGRVVSADDHGVRVDVRFSRPDEAEQAFSGEGSSDDAGRWFLDRIPFSRGRDVARKALLQFLWSADRSVAEIVVHGNSGTAATAAVEQKETLETDRPRPAVASSAGATVPVADPADDLDDLCFSEGLTAELNEEQEAAIRSAVSSTTYHLIHGPPGTGKTRVLARLIVLCLDRGERLLVTCPTNVALDALLVAVMDLGVKDFIRVARRSHVSETFAEAVRRVGNPPVFLGDLCALDMGFSAFRKLVRAKRLVGATAYQCAAHPFFLRQRFDRVIVDEAGQLDEPSTLAPLALARKFVLGGDHLQLPPVVQTRQEASPGADEPSLERSLFERLFLTSPAESISRLTMQYRMNQEVQDIPSRLFYEGALYPAPEVRRRRLNIHPGVSGDRVIDKVIDPEPPVIFVDVQGPHSGKARPEEAETACRIVESLVASGVQSHEIGIITPYRAQQALIRNRLKRSGNGFPLLTVDTVDRFQGGEREVIILSLCRADEVTSFLADRKRLNVSLSRARSKLILLGHGPVLESHPLFASILTGLEKITVSAEAP